VVGCAVCWSVVLAGQSRPLALALGTVYLLASMYRGGRVNWVVYVVGSLGVTFVLDALAASANRLEELRADDLAVSLTGPVTFATGLYSVGTTTDGAGGVAGPNPFGRRRTLLQRLTAPYPTVEARLARLGVSPDDITDATEARATESTD
jgi:Zn-dependent protease with chaperone function